MIQEPVVQAPRTPAYDSHRPPLKIVRVAHAPEGQKPKLLDRVRGVCSPADSLLTDG
jgi:hypothetical protein